MKTAVRCASLLALACTLLGAAWAAEPAETAALDAPWKIIQTTAAQYPHRQTVSGVSHGEARVRISIDTNGKLLDALVVSCSHHDFGDEALRAIKQWRYEAEQVKGESVGIVADIIFVFEVNGPILVEKRSPNEKEKSSPDAAAYKAVAFALIDHTPNPLQKLVSPVYPDEWQEHGIKGKATVEFYIDETGKTRIPVVTSTSHPLLGASAIAAVSQWKFEPPVLHGKPVLVHIEQVFTFQPEKK